MLLNITGGPDMTLFEINEASSLIQAEAHEEANIIFGTVVDERMGDEIRITVIATGFEDTGKKKGLSNLTALSANRSKDIAIPAYIRKSHSGNGDINVIRMGLIDDNEDPDLEIPTFLRRQAD